MPETKTVVPVSCPICRSTDVKTNGKNPLASYWRCDTCGEMWHPERLPRSLPTSDYRR